MKRGGGNQLLKIISFAIEKLVVALNKSFYNWLYFFLAILILIRLKTDLAFVKKISSSAKVFVE